MSLLAHSNRLLASNPILFRCSLYLFSLWAVLWAPQGRREEDIQSWQWENTLNYSYHSNSKIKIKLPYMTYRGYANTEEIPQLLLCATQWTKAGMKHLMVKRLTCWLPLWMDIFLVLPSSISSLYITAGFIPDAIFPNQKSLPYW